jgi:hypothetical protein
VHALGTKVIKGAGHHPDVVKDRPVSQKMGIRAVASYKPATQPAYSANVPDCHPRLPATVAFVRIAGTLAMKSTVLEVVR